MGDPIALCAAKDLFSASCSFDDTAIEYRPGFNLASLRPAVGDLFRFFIAVRFISFDHRPIAERLCFGSTYYALHSDLAAVAVHTGCLYVNPKWRMAAARRLCTVQNLYELMSTSESQYAKSAIVIDLPLDFGLRGLLVQVYIDSSPGGFPSTQHNGLRSTEWTQATSLSLRITHSVLVTTYDPLPRFVPPVEFRRQSAICPVFHFALNDEIAVDFTPAIFLQIFSRLNVAKGLFRIFKLFFDCDNCRYEIVHVGDCTFKVLQGRVEIVPEAEMYDFHVTRRAIGVQSIRFDPVDGIILMPHPGKLSRSGSLSRIE
jgi:hypothetical protein